MFLTKEVLMRKKSRKALKDKSFLSSDALQIKLRQETQRFQRIFLKKGSSN